MSYDQYRDFVGKMTEAELEEEIKRLNIKVSKSKTREARAAWGRMQKIALDRQTANASK
jgi:hypothetical protein